MRPGVAATCHPERPCVARELCSRCYAAVWYAERGRARYRARLVRAAAQRERDAAWLAERARGGALG